MDLTARVYTEESKVYCGLNRHRGGVNHGVADCVREMTHTNCLEYLRSMPRRGYQGKYHRILPKCLDRYLNKFSGRNKVREADTIRQMAGRVAVGIAKGKDTYWPSFAKCNVDPRIGQVRIHPPRPVSLCASPALGAWQPMPSPAQAV